MVCNFVILVQPDNFITAGLNNALIIKSEKVGLDEHFRLILSPFYTEMFQN